MRHRLHSSLFCASLAAAALAACRKSDVPARMAEFGEPALATESKVEFSARYFLDFNF